MLHRVLNAGEKPRLAWAPVPVLLSALGVAVQAQIVNLIQPAIRLRVPDPVPLPDRRLRQGSAADGRGGPGARVRLHRTELL